MPGPLEGIRVLDFTWALAGPFGTMILADLGAEVWKVEPVGITEEERGPGPMVGGTNTYFFSVNRGKHSIEIDLKSDRGRELALSLSAHADVVCENFSPGTMSRLGLGYEAMNARNSRLIYASTSGFGQTGPDANRGAVDIIVQAMSGVLSITGEPGGRPVRPGYSIGDMAAGMFTTIGVLAALVERERSGLGQRIDVAMLDAQVTLLENAVVRYFATGKVPKPLGTRHPLLTPFQAFPTADGWIVIAEVKDWALFCATLGLDELVADERFSSNDLRTANHALLEPLLEAALRARPAREWLGLLSAVCLVAPVNSLDRMTGEPQVAARDMFVDLASPAGERLRVANTPVRLSRTPGGAGEGADAPGGHTDAVLTGVLGLTEDDVLRLRAQGVVG